MTKRSRYFSVSYYLIALLLMIVASPFIESWAFGKLLESIIMTLVFLSAVLATGAGRKSLAGIVVLAVMAVSGRWAYYLRPGLVHPSFYQALGILIIGFTAYRLFLFILRAPRVDFEVLCAGVATYLTVGLLWALTYIWVEQIAPGSFCFTVKEIPAHAMKGFTALYFSFATLCTVGYGDIVPATGVTRMLTMVEAGVGVFYVAIMISRLVSQHSSEILRNPRGSEEMWGQKKSVMSREKD